MSESNIVLYDKRNLLVKRREIRLQLSIPSGQPTPSRKQLKEQIAKALNAEQGQIVIVKVKPEYGTNILKVDANIYDSPNSVPVIERTYLLNRDQGLKKQKTEAAQPAAASEQKT